MKDWKNWFYGFGDIDPKVMWRMFAQQVKMLCHRTKKEMKCLSCEDGKITFMVPPAMVDDFGPVTKAQCNKCGTWYIYSWHVTPLGGYGVEIPKAMMVKR